MRIKNKILRNNIQSIFVYLQRYISPLDIVDIKQPNNNTKYNYNYTYKNIYNKNKKLE